MVSNNLQDTDPLATGSSPPDNGDEPKVNTGDQTAGQNGNVNEHVNNPSAMDHVPESTEPDKEDNLSRSSEQPVPPPAADENPVPPKKGKRRIIPTLSAAVLCVLAVVIGIYTVSTYNSYQDEMASLQEERSKLESTCAQLETEIEDEKKKFGDLELEYDSTIDEINNISNDIKELEIFVSPDGETTQDYLNIKMTDLLDLRQELVNDICNCIETGFLTFTHKFSLGEYVMPERPDPSRELLTDAITQITGGGIISDIIVNTAQAVIDNDGADLIDTINDATLSSVGDQVSAAVQNKVTDMMGLTPIMDGVQVSSDVISAIQNIISGTPDEAIATTLQKASSHMNSVVDILYNSSPSLDDLKYCLDEYCKLISFGRTAVELKEGNRDSFVMGAGNMYNEISEIEMIDRAIGVCSVLMEENAS